MTNSYNTPDLEKQISTGTPPDGNLTATESPEHVPVKSDSNFVYLGNQKYSKRDLMYAFGGTLNPGVAAPPSHKFANPAPLGLSAFALTTFVLSVVNCRGLGITTPNVVVGLAAFYGGLVQLLAGMWEISLENTFGGVALSSYGGFWMSYAAIQIPWFGIKEAYTDAIELENALGFYLLSWTIFTYGLCSLTLKSTVMFFSLFFFLGHTFLLLSIGAFTQNYRVNQGAGALGILTAIIAWYNAYAGVATKQNSYFTITGCRLPWNKKQDAQ